MRGAAWRGRVERRAVCVRVSKAVKTELGAEVGVEGKYVIIKGL